MFEVSVIYVFFVCSNKPIYGHKHTVVSFDVSDETKYIGLPLLTFINLYLVDAATTSLLVYLQPADNRLIKTLKR